MSRIRNSEKGPVADRNIVDAFIKQIESLEQQVQAQEFNDHREFVFPYNRRGGVSLIEDYGTEPSGGRTIFIYAGGQKANIAVRSTGEGELWHSEFSLRHLRRVEKQGPDGQAPIGHMIIEMQRRALHHSRR